MKKRIGLILFLVLCVLCIAGCRFSINITPGMSSFLYEDADRYTMGGSSISNTVEKVDIEWISGQVRMEVHDKNTIEFSETANENLNENNSLYYWLDDKTLHIKFCRSGKWDFTDLEKDMTIYLPQELILKELNVESISAVIIADDVHAQKLELESVSGDVSVKGSEMNEINADSISGDVSIVCRTMPKEMEIDTVSGSVELFLGESADFTLNFETVSGDLSSDIPFRVSGDSYTCGVGTYQYEIDTVSGDVSIRIQD